MADGRAAIDETLKQSRELRSTSRPRPMPPSRDTDFDGKASDDIFTPMQDEDPIPVMHAPRGKKMKTLGIEWTVAYYVLLVVGAVAFWQQLGPLTESANKLAEV